MTKQRFQLSLLEHSWFWCYQPDLTQFAEKRMGVVDPVRHLSKNLPGAEAIESSTLQSMHYIFILMPVTLNHPIDISSPSRFPTKFITPKFCSRILEHKTFSGLLGHQVLKRIRTVAFDGHPQAVFKFYKQH